LRRITTNSLAIQAKTELTTNYSTGHEAEQDAAEYLVNNGFKIVEVNWKTRFCEIDIIAEKNKEIYFVEVKSRKNSKQGYGLDYVTPKKLQQMRFAAEMWINKEKWTGPYQLSAIGIDGGEISFVDCID
jgi:Holliday junction resolvase-like predicted endonuclease